MFFPFSMLLTPPPFLWIIESCLQYQCTLFLIHIYATLTKSRSFLSSDENVWAGFGSGTGNHVGVLAGEKLPYSKFQHSSVALFLRVGYCLHFYKTEELHYNEANTQPEKYLSASLMFGRGLRSSSFQGLACFTEEYSEMPLHLHQNSKKKNSSLKKSQKPGSLGLLSIKNTPSRSCKIKPVLLCK